VQRSVEAALEMCFVACDLLEDVGAGEQSRAPKPIQFLGEASGLVALGADLSLQFIERRLEQRDG
jgi:hypothetical protein